MDELSKFYENMIAEVKNRADIEGQENFLSNTFTEIMLERLEEEECVAPGGLLAQYNNRRGAKIDAYAIKEADETDDIELTLYVTIFQDEEQIFSVPPSEAKDALSKAENFYLRSQRAKFHEDMEESSEGFDIAKTIFDISNNITEVKLILLTNGTVRNIDLPQKEENGVIVTQTIWDIERLLRVTPGPSREPIEIMLADYINTPLQCIKVDTPFVEHIGENGVNRSGGYTSYLTALPALMLYNIYKEYGARLLEKNVRAFLQAKGGVNKGIRGTIQKQPEMFMAFNNGISATAESVAVENETEHSANILSLKDFQIVNGGQTTASIYNTPIKNKNALSLIYVPAKITVLADNDEQRMADIVGEISRCANTQNKVQQADFSTNHAFHIGMEKLSRVTYTRAHGGQKPTKWFYERARGQYAEEKQRNNSSKKFESEYPKKQIFDKLTLARVENVWAQMPYLTSQGGQKSFAIFMGDMKKRFNTKDYVPDEDYYKKLIAKTIMYRNIRTIVQAKQFKGFWANITDYTMAYISYVTAQQIDLITIWNEQKIPKELHDFASQISEAVYNYILDSSNGQNPTQWCKKESCWEKMKTDLKQKNQMGVSKIKAIIDTSSTQKKVEREETPQEKVICDAFGDLNPDILGEICAWGKQTGNLNGWEIQFAASVAKQARWGRRLSIKQAKKAAVIYKEADDKGFDIGEEARKFLLKFPSLVE